MISIAKYPQVNIRADDEFIGAVDEWRRSQPDIPTRPEAIRRLARIGMSQKGNEPKDENQRKRRSRTRSGDDG